MSGGSRRDGHTAAATIGDTWYLAAKDLATQDRKSGVQPMWMR